MYGVVLDEAFGFDAMEAARRLRSEGVDTKLGGINRFTSVADALDNLNSGMSEANRNSSRAD